MIQHLYATEQHYTRLFTEHYEDNAVIRFWDDKLPDMYCHNYTFIKSPMHLKDIIENEIRLRKEEKNTFLRIETNFDVDKAIISELSVSPEVSLFDFMIIDTDKYEAIKCNKDCIVKKADNPKIMEQGKGVDIKASEANMGREFAEKRINRKLEAYNDESLPISFYVCYYNDIPVGKCELLISKNAAKIEDFDILEQYQRKGLGSAVLKHLIREAKAYDKAIAYVITDNGDTAKDMYTKCGFVKVGQKTELFFKL